MGDRGRQIVSEWFNKCANVILQSRVAGTDADDHAPNERQNRWFNLDVGEHEAYASALQPWKNAAEPPPLVIEIYLESPRERRGGAEGADTSAPGRTLVERWVLHHSPDESTAVTAGGSVLLASSSQSMSERAVEVPVVYKRAVIMIRTLHTLLRNLPANRFYRARRRGLTDQTAKMACAVRAVPFDDAGKPLGRPDEDADRHTTVGGVSGSFRTYTFTSVATASGYLNASVYFLDAKALAALDYAPPAVEPLIITDYWRTNPGATTSDADAAADADAVCRAESLTPAEALTTHDPGGAAVGAAPGTAVNSARRMNSWAGRATYFPSTAAGAGGAVSYSTGTGTPPRGPGGLPRMGSRGLLSEEMAKQGSSLGSSPSGAGARPPLAPAAFGGQGGLSGCPPGEMYGGLAAGGVSLLNRSQSSDPMLGDVGGDGDDHHVGMDHAPMSAPTSAPAPIYGFAQTSPGQQIPSAPHAATVIGSNPGGGDGHSLGRGGGRSFLTSRMAASPPLPFASSAPRSTGGSSALFSLASPRHVLNQRPTSSDGAPTPGSGSAPNVHAKQRPRSGGSRHGSLTSSSRACHVSDESPPWNFKGLSSPGAGGDPGGSVGAGSGGGSGEGTPTSQTSRAIVASGHRGGRHAYPSWSSPSSSLSISMHESSLPAAGSVGLAIGTPLHVKSGSQGSGHGPFAYGASLGTSPSTPGGWMDRGSGTPGGGAHYRLALPPGGESSVTVYAASDAFNASDMFESDPLPFVLDDDDLAQPSPPRPYVPAHPFLARADAEGVSSNPGGGGGGTAHHGAAAAGGAGVDMSEQMAVHRAGSGIFTPGSDQADAAVGALVRMLQDAPPLREGPMQGGHFSSAGEKEKPVGEASSSVSPGKGGGPGRDAQRGAGDFTLDWAMTQLSQFRAFKSALDGGASIPAEHTSKDAGKEPSVQAATPRAPAAAAATATSSREWTGTLIEASSDITASRAANTDEERPAEPSAGTEERPANATPPLLSSTMEACAIVEELVVAAADASEAADGEGKDDDRNRQEDVEDAALKSAAPEPEEEGASSSAPMSPGDRETAAKEEAGVDAEEETNLPRAEDGKEEEKERDAEEREGVVNHA